MSEPVTAEELAAAGPCAVSLTSIAPYHAKAASFGGASFEFHARAQTTVERAAELLPRLARALAAERARTAESEADRDALAAKIETMLRDEEDARALRLAEHAAREDVAAKLAELQAAVRAHEAAAKGDPSRLVIAAERMWTAAKT